MAQSLVWVAGSNGSLMASAVCGGSNFDGEVLYVARIRLPSAGLTPGKLATSYGIAHASYDAKEIYLPEYDILTNPNRAELKWVPFNSMSFIPPNGAVLGGSDPRSGDLYVARARRPDGMYVPGKASYTDQKVYIPYGGREETFTTDCDVLVA